MESTRDNKHETLKTLWILLHKNFLVRKKSWFHTVLFQCFIPLFLISVFSSLVRYSHVTVDQFNDTFYEIETINDLLQSIDHRNILYYTPNNSKTWEIMDRARKCLNSSENEIFGFNNENDMLHAIIRKETELMSTPLSYEAVENFIGVVFDLDEDKKFKYTIRLNEYVTKDLYESYITYASISTWGLADRSAPFGITQLCIDQSIINGSTSKLPYDYEMSVQKMPRPQQLKENYKLESVAHYLSFMMLTFLFISFFLEALFPMQERISGATLLLATNGISNSLNLFSWLLTSTNLASLWMTVALFFIWFTSGYPIHSLLLYWTALIILTANFVNFGLHISSYFKRRSSLLIIWFCIHFGTTVLHFYLVEKSNHKYLPGLSVLFPNVLFRRFLEEFIVFLPWDDLANHQVFKSNSQNHNATGSPFFIMITGLIGNILHFLLADLIYSIRLGTKSVIVEQSKVILNGFRNIKDRFDVELQTLYEDVERERQNQSEGTDFSGIQIVKLKKSYFRFSIDHSCVKSLNGVSMDANEGQITTLLGYSRSGKTTLQKLLTGTMTTGATDGTILINGKNPVTSPDEVRFNVGVCSQDNLLFPSLTTLRQLTLIGQLKSREKTKHQVEEDAKTLLKQLNLFAKRNDYPRDLALSEKRRLCFAMSLISDSRVIILDEPTFGMDAENKRFSWNLLTSKREEKTILILTQDIEEIEALSDKNYFLHEGKILNYDSTSGPTKDCSVKNVKIILSTEAWADTGKIKGEFPEDTQIISAKDGETILLSSNNVDLATALDIVEQGKNRLGVTKVRVRQTGIEDLYTKALQENELEETRENSASINKFITRDPIDQTFIASLQTKFTFMKKNIYIYVLMFVIPLLPLFAVSQYTYYFHSINNQVKFDFKLEAYSDAEVLYKSDLPNLGRMYESFVRPSAENVVSLEGQSVHDALLKYGRDYPSDYKFNLVIAAEFNRSSNNIVKLNGYYGDLPSIGVPVTINAMSNALLKTVCGSNCEIDVSYKQLPGPTSQRFSDKALNDAFNTFKTIFLITFFYMATGLFLVLPLRENLAKFKHLQRLSGVSAISYWKATFAADMIVYVLFVVFLLTSLKIFSLTSNVVIFTSLDLLKLAVLLLLFGLNLLPLLYIFSFYFKSMNSALVMFCIMPMLLILGYITVDAKYLQSTPILGPIGAILFYVIPYINFFFSERALYITAVANARCRHIPKVILDMSCFPRGFFSIRDYCCQSPDCSKGQCRSMEKDEMAFLTQFDFKEVLAIMLLGSIVFFGVLYWLESTALNFTGNPNSKKSSRFSIDCCLPGFVSPKNRKIKESDDAESFEDKNLLLASILYKNLKINTTSEHGLYTLKSGECLELLNISIAAKNCLFKQVNLGIEDGYSPVHIGFCFQKNILLKSLSAYDHLALFGRLRNISKQCLEAEIDRWITLMNLNNVADQPCVYYNEGCKKRLSLAIALIGNPSLIFLDQPLNRIDPITKRIFWSALRLCREQGQAIILTCSSFNDSGSICDRLVSMHENQLLWVTPSELQKTNYEAGYDIFIRLNMKSTKEDIERIKAGIEVSVKIEVIEEELNQLHYHVADPQTSWKLMYMTLSDTKENFTCIDNFTILSGTLGQFYIQTIKFGNETNKSLTKID